MNLNSELILEIQKYGLVGIVVYSFDYSIYFFIVSISYEHYLLANILGKVSGALLGFYLHRKWTFKKGNYRFNSHSQFIKYIVLFGFNIVFSSILLFVAESYSYILDIRISRILIDVLIITTAFLVSKLLIFKTL